MSIAAGIIAMKDHGVSFFDLPKKLGFTRQLKEILRHKDVEQNLKTIYEVAPKFHHTFIELLKSGYNLEQANKIYKPVFELECLAPFTTQEIVQVLRKNKIENPTVEEVLPLLNVKNQLAGM